VRAEIKATIEHCIQHDRLYTSIYRQSTLDIDVRLPAYGTSIIDCNSRTKIRKNLTVFVEILGVFLESTHLGAITEQRSQKWCAKRKIPKCSFYVEDNFIYICSYRKWFRLYSYTAKTVKCDANHCTYLLPHIRDLKIMSPEHQGMK
jgi:hypothetical protein